MAIAFGSPEAKVIIEKDYLEAAKLCRECHEGKYQHDPCSDCFATGIFDLYAIPGPDDEKDEEEDCPTCDGAGGFYVCDRCGYEITVGDYEIIQTRALFAVEKRFGSKKNA